MNLCVAPCLFGLEGVLAGELTRMGIPGVKAENGRVFFEGGVESLARVCVGARTAERAMLVLGQFRAETFEELFQAVRRLPLEELIGQKDAFPVAGWSLQSTLHSVPDCQRIIKKAAVERLRSIYHTTWFEETGPVRQLRFSLHKNVCTLMLDPTGEGLHKRGYRVESVLAPIKETLAAGMEDIARVRLDQAFVDPFCGSGTFLVEAAMRARNIAPGLARSFAAERWDAAWKSRFAEAKAQARAQVKALPDYVAHGYDIDPAAVELTRENARRAGVAGNVRAEVRPVEQFEMPEGKLMVVTNPPYGERLGDLREAERIVRVMGERFVRRPYANYYIISPCENFESLFGHPADKRRKLYNGMLKCDMYCYFKW